MILKSIPFYKYEERNDCPKCRGQLTCTGAINNTDYFKCVQCGSEFSVGMINGITENGTRGFFGYDNIKEINK